MRHQDFVWFQYVRRAAPWLLVACLVAGTVGCSERAPTTYPVTVKVAYPDKKPVVGAQVVLRSEEQNTMARGTTSADGSCRVTTMKPDDGAVLGRHMVIVAQPPLKGDPDVPYRGPQIANKFQSFATSGLEITVAEDESKNVFALTVTAR